MPHFGRRILGNAAFDAEANKEAKGGHHFGPRITGTPAGQAVGGAPGHFAKPDVNAKGPRLTNADGSPPSTSIEELRSILTENGTYFDSLYDAELARAGGPRKAALEFFHSFEASDKGQRRPQYLVEMAGLLSQVPVTKVGQSAAAVRQAAKATGTVPPASTPSLTVEPPKPAGTPKVNPHQNASDPKPGDAPNETQVNPAAAADTGDKPAEPPATIKGEK